ncbi:MAG: glycosyltransferase, partial [Lachnospiraceae bacterium]|nr:glycosyltransferase [Lachnospiraceae bacterium]
MKIAIISHGASGGGSERVATILANYFVSKNHDVFFYAIHSDGREYHLDDRIHYEFCEGGKIRGLKGMINRTFALRRFVKRNKIDTLISFIYEEGISVCGLKSVNRIFSLRNDPNQISGFKAKLISHIYEKANSVVFQTEDARAFFGEKIRNHGAVIPNPIKSGLPFWDVNDHNKELIAAGRLSNQKNFKMLINSFAYFSEKHPDYRLTICGEGGLKDSLVAQATELGVADKIAFPGHVTDIHDRMTKAGIYVSSSDFEGISNSMLEAMAVGIPVVCTDCPVGGARMFINDGVNGYLVPVGDD